MFAIIILAMLGASGLTSAYILFSNIVKKQAVKNKSITDGNNEIELFRLNEPLPDVVWEEVRVYAKNTVGCLLVDAIIKEIIKQGYRFTCSHIYELRKIYKGWNSYKKDNSAAEHVNKITKYKLVLQIEAEETVYNILNDIHERERLNIKEITMVSQKLLSQEKLSLEID